jgi:hypothetical protein
VTERDSFLEEVAEEVRRDRMFALMRRYGWIAVLAVLLIVGGAAWNEWRKAQATERARATGDAILGALQQSPDARAEALAAIAPDAPGAAAAVTMLRAGALAEGGESAAAAEALEGIGGPDSDLAPVYGQIAAFKALLQQGDAVPAEERRQGFSALAGTGGAMRLLAEEQIALIDIETGDTEAALERLETIRADSAATPGLRRRAAQLIVALGGEPRPMADG